MNDSEAYGRGQTSVGLSRRHQLLQQAARCWRLHLTPRLASALASQHIQRLDNSQEAIGRKTCNTVSLYRNAALYCRWSAGR